MVALELKVEPRKSERDRCAGQCARFAQEWLTIVVVIEPKPSRLQKLLDTLDYAGLNHVAVIAIAEHDGDDEDEDDDSEE